MEAPLTSTLLSVSALLTLVFLITAERRRGRRYGDRIRRHFDFWVLKLRHIFHVRAQETGKYLVRQIVHYLLHTLLSTVLALLLKLEQSVKNVLRSNRAMARSSNKERVVRNKLEEVALHKMEVALSEEEKRRRKERLLQ